ncbi:hypothetical protein HVW37_22680 [Escherichia coli]|nr:hypothetical protein HVW37_22680 [Escherichia coli]
MAFLTSSDKALWHLALPMIFSNITVPLLGLVDTAVIGHLDSPVYLGGVAVGATATSFLFMLLLFLRMSTTGLTAQAYGAKNPQALARALDGFAYAVEAHSGQAYGARDGSQLLDVWRAACRQSGIVALLFSVVYLLAGEHIIALLTSLTQIQQLADRYLIWQVILPLVGVWCYLLDGMFIGATRAAEMRNSMAVAAAGFALTLLTLPWLGNHGLWLALTVFLALRGLSLAAIWRRHWRNGTWFAAT